MTLSRWCATAVKNSRSTGGGGQDERPQAPHPSPRPPRRAGEPRPGPSPRRRLARPGPGRCRGRRALRPDRNPRLGQPGELRRTEGARRRSGQRRGLCDRRAQGETANHRLGDGGEVQAPLRHRNHRTPIQRERRSGRNGAEEHRLRRRGLHSRERWPRRRHWLKPLPRHLRGSAEHHRRSPSRMRRRLPGPQRRQRLHGRDDHRRRQRQDQPLAPRRHPGELLGPRRQRDRRQEGTGRESLRRRTSLLRRANLASRGRASLYGSRQRSAGRRRSIRRGNQRRHLRHPDWRSSGRRLRPQRPVPRTAERIQRRAGGRRRR